MQVGRSGLKVLDGIGCLANIIGGTNNCALADYFGLRGLFGALTHADGPNSYRSPETEPQSLPQAA